MEILFSELVIPECHNMKIKHILTLFTTMLTNLWHEHGSLLAYSHGLGCSVQYLQDQLSLEDDIWMRKPVVAHNKDANAGICSRKQDHVHALSSLLLSAINVICGHFETGCSIMTNALAY
jgi:hypothetical protein